jgi:hypothetical protein
MNQGSFGGLHCAVDIFGTSSIDSGNGIISAVQNKSIAWDIEIESSGRTNAGSKEVMVWPLVAGTNSLLINSPVGCW